MKPAGSCQLIQPGQVPVIGKLSAFDRPNQPLGLGGVDHSLFDHGENALQLFVAQRRLARAATGMTMSCARTVAAPTARRFSSVAPPRVRLVAVSS